jgi:hypothetical protein
MQEENITPEVEEVLPVSQELLIDETPEEDDEESGEILAPVTEDYTSSFDPSAIVLNLADGAIVDTSKLSPMDKIRMIQEKMGLNIEDPDPKCKHCHGRGYTGVFIDGTPSPCKCLTRSFTKDNKAFGGDRPSVNRALIRKYKKLYSAKPTQTKKDAIDKKWQKTIMNTPIYKAKNEQRKRLDEALEVIKSLRREAEEEVLSASISDVESPVETELLEATEQEEARG